MKPITREELLLYTKEMLFHKDKLILEKRRQEDGRKTGSEKKRKNESQNEKGKQGKEFTNTGGGTQRD